MCIYIHHTHHPCPSVLFTSAPSPMNRETVSLWPPEAAMCSAVHPFCVSCMIWSEARTIHNYTVNIYTFSTASRSALLSSSSLTISLWPRSAAMWRGVWPCLSASLILAPAVMRVLRYDTGQSACMHWEPDGREVTTGCTYANISPLSYSVQRSASIAVPHVGVCLCYSTQVRHDGFTSSSTGKVEGSSTRQEESHRAMYR